MAATVLLLGGIGLAIVVLVVRAAMRRAHESRSHGPSRSTVPSPDVGRDGAGGR
jgi:hypothetical protein